MTPAMILRVNLLTPGIRSCIVSAKSTTRATQAPKSSMLNKMVMILRILGNAAAILYVSTST